MPLNATDQPGNLDNSRMAIAFWMTIVGVESIEPIRVFVTYEALAQIDPSQLRDAHGALETFDKHRTQIEAAASHKFDVDGVDDGTYGRQPILIVRSDDISLD
jgi:hypothetical protein